MIARPGNTLVGLPIPVGSGPDAIAVTPDGLHAYVVNRRSANVSVIRTATNLVVATVPVGSIPLAVGIVPHVVP